MGRRSPATALPGPRVVPAPVAIVADPEPLGGGEEGGWSKRLWTRSARWCGSRPRCRDRPTSHHDLETPYVGGTPRSAGEGDARPHSSGWRRQWARFPGRARGFDRDPEVARQGGWSASGGPPNQSAGHLREKSHARKGAPAGSEAEWRPEHVDEEALGAKVAMARERSPVPARVHSRPVHRARLAVHERRTAPDEERGRTSGSTTWHLPAEPPAIGARRTPMVSSPRLSPR